MKRPAQPPTLVTLDGAVLHRATGEQQLSLMALSLE